MIRWRWVLTLLGILGLVLLVDYFVLHVLFPWKKAAILEEINRRVELSLKHQPVESSSPGQTPSESMDPAAPSNPAEASVPSTSNSEETDNFAETLAACWQDHSHSQAQNPVGLVRDLEATGVRERRLQLENWHLRLPSGEEKRIMLLPSDRENANGRLEVRLFDVDAEGLPVPQKLGPKAYNPSARFLQELKSQGEIQFHQRKENIALNDGQSLDVEWINGQLHDLQVFTNNKSFSCRNLNCHCQ